MLPCDQRDGERADLDVGSELQTSVAVVDLLMCELTVKGTCVRSNVAAQRLRVGYVIYLPGVLRDERSLTPMASGPVTSRCTGGMHYNDEESRSGIRDRAGEEVSSDCLPVPWIIPSDDGRIKKSRSVRVDYRLVRGPCVITSDTSLRRMTLVA